MITEAICPQMKDCPHHNYVGVSCDGCQASCPQARIPFGSGPRDTQRAELAALNAGWATYVTMKMTDGHIVASHRMLCPACQPPESVDGNQELITTRYGK